MSFIGFCSYYSRFIKYFAEDSKISSLDNEKDSRFAWKPECHNAFEKMKAALINSLVLKHRDYISIFIVKKDVRDNSLRAVLSKIVKGVKYPVVFASRVLTPA